MMKDFIFLDGEIFKNKMPLRSLFYGEGAFETVRWKSVKPRYLDDHIKRLKKGAELLEIPFPSEEEIIERTSNCVLRSRIKDAYVKICLLSKGGNVFYSTPSSSSLLVVVGEYRGAKDQVSVCVTSFKRSRSSSLLRVKTLNYLENILSRREAIKRGFDDAVFLNDNDELAEATSSNVFWVRGKAIFTPSVDCGILPGITRGLVLKIAAELGYEVNERKFRLSYLLNSDFAFLTNSLVGTIYVNKINEQKMPKPSVQYSELKSLLIDRLMW